MQGCTMQSTMLWIRAYTKVNFVFFFHDSKQASLVVDNFLVIASVIVSTCISNFVAHVYCSNVRVLIFIFL